MAKYVFSTDLPEVTYDSKHKIAEIDGESWHIDGVWKTPARWRQQAMNYLAIAEYLDNLKPQLPTEPGSVILATKIADHIVSSSGACLVKRGDGRWYSFLGTLSGVRSSDIEDWKPVQLHVVEVSS